MIKTLDKAINQEKEPFVIPRKVQDTIPVRRIWPDGIFFMGESIQNAGVLRISTTFKAQEIRHDRGVYV